MDNKSDVKAIMARFQAGGTSIEPGTAGGRPKVAVHPTLSGPAVPSKKPVLETSLSGSAAAAAANSTTPKPSYLKSTVSTKSAPESRESPRPKAFISRFENTNEDSSKPPFIKPVKPKPPDSSQESEQKSLFPKAVPQKPLTSIAALESKNVFPKPPAVTTKPPWAPKTENNGTSPNATPPKIPAAPKPTSSIARMRQQPESEDVEAVIKPFSSSGARHSSFRAAQNMFNKVEEAAKEDTKPLSSKESPASATAPKPNYGRKPSASSMKTGNDDPSAPKKKPLPNILALGSAPSKPNRPPRVNLDKFKKSAESASEAPEIKKVGPPPPPAAHPSHAASGLRPSLPPRHPGAIIPPDQDENYDDVGDLKDSLGGSFRRQAEESGSDEEMYEDLDERWSAAEAKEQEKDKKREKEEKKRAEQEKKDQKERERKEQEARKKFKLSGNLQVIHKVKARVDCKGGKNELSIKQGEPIEILRITDNPEGRWLARTQDGSFGYVKTESVEIDFDKLRNQGLSFPTHVEQDDGEVYDDVAPQDELNRSHGGSGLVLPPPPDGEDVYDDLDDPSLMVSSSPEPRFLHKPRSFLRMLKVPIERRKSPVFNNVVPPPAQFTQDGNTDQSPEEIYDDVDPFPPPPPLSSLPRLKPKAEIKTDDLKKQKKFEKEEKEFKKKFKFEGEIQVLYQVTAANNKKASGRDLAVQVGDILDVISKPEPDKLICRNKEGKFGYVSTSNIQSEDNDIYDDIGDDCIYDND